MALIITCLYIFVSPPTPGKFVSLLSQAKFHGPHKIIHCPNLYPVIASPCGVERLRENIIHNDGTGSHWKCAALPFAGHKGVLIQCRGDFGTRIRCKQGQMPYNLANFTLVN